METNKHLDSKIGEKIRNFRKRAGKSQFELELEIEASPGSMSRIESGQVNPTKETIQKVVDALDLNSYEAGLLFNVDTNSLPNVVNVAKKLSILDLDKVLQNAVNEIVFELGLNGAVLFLIESGTLYTKTVTESLETNIMLKILNLVRFNLHISINKSTENLCVRSVREQRSFVSNNLHDFTMDVLNRPISELCAKVTSHKSGLVMPIIYEGESIGAVFFSQSYYDDFKKEYALLKSFTDHLALSIVNAQSYSRLQQEVMSLRNK